jgi:lactate racemase
MSFFADLAYGAETIRVTFSREPQILDIDEPRPAIDPQLFRERLDHFLKDAALDLRDPAVVVADKTRLCGYPVYLPVLAQALLDHGADAARLTFYIAYGTHAQQDEHSSRTAYGDTYGRFRWVHHCCDDRAAFVELGRTGRGTPVRLRADILRASCLITFGAVNHHYFAGYGGGRKLVFPGLGERAAVHANHGLFLDRGSRRLATGCRSGVLDGNPLAEDLAEIESFRPADLAVHGILDSRGRVCDLRVGCGAAHFRQACAAYGAHCELPAQQYDLVLGSCGGFPRDINLIQSHKALHHAAAFVRDGGRLIMLAQCPDGVGSTTFLPWFDMGGWEAAFDRLADHYVGNGGTALAMMEKLRRIRIGLVTELAPSIARTIGLELYSAAEAARIAAGHEGSLAVMPHAGLVVAITGSHGDRG